jgi:hypothetical protein
MYVGGGGNMSGFTTTVIVVVACALCVMGLLLSHEVNDDGFRAGETIGFDCVYEGIHVTGEITEDGEHYIIDATLDTEVDNFIFTGYAKGRSDNVLLSIVGPFNIGSTEYVNLEGTSMLQVMIDGCTR